MALKYPQTNSINGSPSRVTDNFRHMKWVMVAICVAYLQPMHSVMQHKESIPEHLSPEKYRPFSKDYQNVQCREFRTTNFCHPVTLLLLPVLGNMRFLISSRCSKPQQCPNSCAIVDMFWVPGTETVT